MGKEWDDLSAVVQSNRGTQREWKRPEWETSKAPKFQNNAPAFDLSLESNRRMQEWHCQWLFEAHRVLQSGGVIKAFSGTRTFHRLAAAMEMAGFTDIRIEAWVYGSGFPKSLNISKAMDKAAGAEREVVGTQVLTGTAVSLGGGNYGGGGNNTNPKTAIPITAPATDEAKLWEGWGTALKPSWEPVIVGRKT